MKEETVGPQMLKSCFSFHKNTVYEFLKPNLDNMKTVNFTWCKVLFTMQKGVDVYCSTNKVIATFRRQLSWAVLWTVTLCQWFWVKEETVGPQMLKSCFSFHKNTVYEFLKPNLDKMKTVNFTYVKSYLLCRKTFFHVLMFTALQIKLLLLCQTA